MSSQSAYYIISISNAKCLENTQKTQKACRLRKWNKSADQKWTLEAKEGQAQTFAFKSVTDGRYLAGLQPRSRDGGVVGVAEEKQYWTLEPGRGPKSWQFKSDSIAAGGYPAYLNDDWGRANDDNRIQTWYLQPTNPSFFTFYLWPTDFADDTGVDASAPSAGAVSKEDLKAANKRAKELEEKQATIEKSEAEAKQKAQEQEDALAKREADIAKREEELKNMSTAQANGAKDDANNDALQRKLQEQEAALVKREAELAERERKLQSSEQGQQNGSSNRMLSTKTVVTTDEPEQLKSRIADLEKQLSQARKRPQGSLLNSSVALISAGGVRPGSGIRSEWDPKLLSAFENGKSAMSARKA